MWNIAICDDDAELCFELRQAIMEIEKKSKNKFTIVEFHSAEELLDGLPVNTDILLMDIKMGDVSGIEAARTLRNNKNDICIIFITSMTQYAIEGYEVHAFGFIKKPLDEIQLERFISEAVKMLEDKRDNEVHIKILGEIVKLKLDSIIYIEAYRHTINMYTTSGVLHPSMTLTELEKILDSKGFFRCHKSYLINLHHISVFAGEKIEMSNKDIVFLSKHRKKDFQAVFARFAGGML